MEDNLNFLRIWKTTSTFQQMKDNLIFIYEMKDKLNHGAKWKWKQAQLDLSLAQLSTTFLSSSAQVPAKLDWVSLSIDFSSRPSGILVKHLE